MRKAANPHLDKESSKWYILSLFLHCFHSSQRSLSSKDSAINIASSIPWWGKWKENTHATYTWIETALQQATQPSTQRRPCCGSRASARYPAASQPVFARSSAQGHSGLPGTICCPSWEQNEALHHGVQSFPSHPDPILMTQPLRLTQPQPILTTSSPNTRKASHRMGKRTKWNEERRSRGRGGYLVVHHPDETLIMWIWC